MRGYTKIWIRLLLHRNEKVRISCAYLFRIRRGNKYLLIKGKKIEQYQPVGGVYKTFNSFEEIANGLDVQVERESTFFENRDLRVFVPGKNVLKFIKWFKTGKNRENNVIREFNEELVEPGFLPKESLTDARFEFIKQADCRLGYSNAFRCKEILIHDIYEVSFSKDIYWEELEKSVNKSNKQLILVLESDIEREAININGIEVKIGAHSKNVL